MDCPRCQQDNPSHAKFCLECAAPFKGVHQSGPPAASHADLQRALAEALDRETATSEVLKVISSSPTDVQPVFDAIAESAARLCDGVFGIVYRLDGEMVHIVAHHNVSPEGWAAYQALYPRPLNRQTNSGRAMLDGRVAITEDIEADTERSTATREAARRVGLRSAVTVPLLHNERTIGALTVGRAEPGAFSPKRVTLLETFAAQAVIAIENVRLFKELEARNRDLTVSLDRQTATADVLRIIAQSPSQLQRVLDAIAASAVRLLRARSGTLSRIVGDQIELAAHTSTDDAGDAATRAAFPQPLSFGGVHAQTIRNRAPLNIADAQTDPRLPEASHTYAQVRGFRSQGAVPMLRHDEVVGAIAVARREPGGFTDDEIALLRTFADQAVIAIENVRLFTELQEKNRALTEAHAQVTESLEQQTATAEILRVISQSQTDAQPVFDTIVTSAVKLCDGLFGTLWRFDGALIHQVAQYNYTPEALEEMRQVYPCRPSRAHGSARAILDRAVVHIPDVEVDREFEPRALSRAVGWRSGLFVPMLREDAPIGAIAVTRATPGPFSENEITLLKTFADQAVIAIENVRLFTELQASNSELTTALDTQTATSDILRVISRSQTDVQPVFEAIAENAARLVQAWSVTVLRWDGESIHLAAERGGSPGSGQRLRDESPWLPNTTSGPGRCIATGIVIHVPDVDLEPEDDTATRELAHGRGWRSNLCVPMLRDGSPIGAISVTRVNAGPFSPGAIELLETFADQAVIAIENVRLFTELQARTRELTRSVGELRALGEVGQAISSTLDLETVLSTIVARATQLSGTDAGVIYEYDEEREVFVPRATEHLGADIVETMLATPVRKGEGATGRLAEIQEPIQVPDILAAPAESRVRGALVRAGYRALLAVPLVRDDHLLGGLTVIRKVTGAFAPEVIELLTTFATQSALAIQNARLFREIADKSHQLEVASQHKSEFLANMSHELRTPLNAIIGFSEVLGERMFGELNEKQDEYLKDIYASGQHLLSLINDILDLSKIEAGRMELELTDFNLPATLENALTLVRERAGRRGIALELSVDQELEQIRADERKVRQVVLNLLSNGIKFTPEGGRIDVRAVPVEGSVEISVSDTGVGVAPEDQEAIFEEFKQVGTAARKVEGTGLGLALSRKFVELHGGRIWVESETGAGSTFTFTIPMRP